MGKVIIIGLVIVIVVGLIIWYLRFNRKQTSVDDAKRNGWAIHGDLNQAQEQELIIHLHSAQRLFGNLVAPSMSLSDPTYISDARRAQIDTWLAQTQAMFTRLQKKERLPQ